MDKRIPLIAKDLKRLYTGFLIAALVLFVLCSWLTNFNPMTLIANGDAFVEFSELPKKLTLNKLALIGEAEKSP